ncbi:MAG TPA: hypothetical protein VN872_05220 [Candidatus Acidoferrum sp.]|nr:hypothetical protein [Candidatus Acidoferrum sp.]
MQADFSVELGSDDPALELPWSSADPHVRYYDLKNHPELLQQIPEVEARPELGLFLSRINAAGFPLATAKCDAWSSEEVAPEEEMFGDSKFVSYIDLVFVNDADRCSFEKHEAFAQDLCRLLGHAPEIAATVELVIRRCYYHQEDLVCENEIGQNDAPLPQRAKRESGNRRTGTPQSSDCGNDVGRDVNTNDPNLRNLQISVASDSVRPLEKSQVESRSQLKQEFQGQEFRSEDTVVSEDKLQLQGNVETEDKVPSDEKIRLRNQLQSDNKVIRKNNVQEEYRLHSDDKVRLEDKRQLEQATVSITGYCFTAYVTGFGDSDHDPVLRWTIGLSLLQYALVQITSR